MSQAKFDWSGDIFGQDKVEKFVLESTHKGEFPFKMFLVDYSINPANFDVILSLFVVVRMRLKI